MLAFFLSPLGRKVGAGLIAAILIGGAIFYVYGKGKEAGRIDGARAQLETDRQQFEQDRKIFLAELAKYKEQDDAAKAQIAQKDTEIAALRNNRLLVRNAIAALPASAVLPDIHRRLGGDVQNPSLSEGELRQLDTTLADYQNLGQQVAVLEAKSSEQDKRINALEHQRDAAVDAYQKLVPLYAKAYNAAQKKHSLFVKIITFGLVRDRKLNLPPPVTP